MDDRKWGSVNLDDDIPLDPENISEWYGVRSLVRGTFERCGHNADAYDLVSERFEPYTVLVMLLRLSEFSPDRTWGLAREIMLSLRSFKHYWLVQIGIYGEWAEDPSGKEVQIWIEIDKYEIYSHMGKVTIQRFDHIAEFFQKNWGTDFGFGP